MKPKNFAWSMIALMAAILALPRCRVRCPMGGGLTRRALLGGELI